MGTGNQLVGRDLKVINIGLSLFAETLKRENVPVVDLDWQPPAQGDLHRAGLLRTVQAASAQSKHSTTEGITKPKPRWELHFGAMAKARQV